MPRGKYPRKKRAKKLGPEFEEVQEINPLGAENIDLRNEVLALQREVIKLKDIIARLAMKLAVM